MKVKELMTERACYVRPSMSLADAARQMKERNFGFLAISDKDANKLQGVITDRDIVIRAVAEGLDPRTTSVVEVKSDKVLYCYADDDLSKAADSMEQQSVYRLLVLSDPRDKQLCGVITLGDIFRHNETKTGSHVAKQIADRVA